MTSFQFVSPATLSANTDYVLAISPQDANLTRVYYMPGNATYVAAYPNKTWYGRANGASAFAETNTRIPCIWPIIDQVDSGGGGGRPEIRGANL